MSTTPSRNRAQSPSATQRMFFELSETTPVDLPKHLQYKSPARRKNAEFSGTSGRYLEPRPERPEPPAPSFTPEYERIHGRSNHSYADASSRYLDYLSKEEVPKPVSFVPLDKTEGVRFDDEVLRMKEYAAKAGFGEVDAKFMESALAKGQFAEGRSPRELAEVTRREKLGIHPRTFRPVSEVCAKTFDEYASMAKVWKKTHAPEGEAEGEHKGKKMTRPSVVMEYVRHNTPILSRKGNALTPSGKEKARVEELRRRERQEFHFVPSPFGGTFDAGPGGDKPKGFKRGVKECYSRERELIRGLAERLSGQAARYSPSRIASLATPVAHHRFDADPDVLAQHYAHTNSAPRSGSRGNSPRPGTTPRGGAAAASTATPGGAASQEGTPQDGAAHQTRRLDVLEDPEAVAQLRRGPQRNKTPLRSQTPRGGAAAAPAEEPLGGYGPQRPRYWR